MRKGQCQGVEHQPWHRTAFKAQRSTIAYITRDGASQVRQMDADLVHATRVRHGAHKGGVARPRQDFECRTGSQRIGMVGGTNPGPGLTPLLFFVTGLVVWLKFRRKPAKGKAAAARAAPPRAPVVAAMND